MSILRHSLWAAASGILITAARFALTAILARRLSPETFGQYVYAQWLVDIGFLVCTLGATGVASRYFAEYRNQPTVLAAIARRWRPFSLGLPFVGSLVAGCGAWASGVSLQAEGYALLMCWGLGAGLWGMHMAALTGLQRFDLVFQSNALASVVMVTGAALVPFGPSGLLPVFAIMATAAAAAALVGIRSIATMTRGVAAKLGRQQVRDIWRYSVNIWLTALLWSLVWSRGEMPVLRGLLGDQAVARYAVALTLYGGAAMGVMLGVSGIAPQITRYWGEGNESAAVTLCRRSMDFQLLLAGLSAMSLIWLAPELLHYGFGARYEDSAMLLGVLALGLPALTVASHNHLLQVITGARYNRDTTVLGILLLMVFCWAGVSVAGIIGAAWARAATLLILGGISVVVCWRRWERAALGPANLVLVISVSALSVLCSALPIFNPFLIRISAWVLSSLLLVAFVRNESNQSLTAFLAHAPLSRIVRANSSI